MTLVISTISIANEEGPSFDCKLASSSIEISICKNPELSYMDYQMGIQYNNFRSKLSKKNNKIARKLQRHWIVNRNSQCTKNKGSDIENCLLKIYEQWLKWSEYGLLRVPLLLTDGKLVKDVLNSNIAFEHTTHIRADKNPNQILGTYDITLNVIKDKKSEIIFRGLKNYPYKQNYYYEENNIDAVWYLMSNTGDVFKAYHHVNADIGPQCVQEEAKTLKFWNDENPFQEYGSLEYYDASYRCIAHIDTLKGVKIQPGKLIFDFLYSGRSHLYIFKDNRYFTVDSEKSNTYWTNYFTDSIDNYYGEKYTELFERIGKDILINHPYQASDQRECSIPKDPILYYEALRGSLDRLEVPMSFKQLQYIAKNVLTKEHLVLAKKFKPLISSILNYLDEAKKIDDWQGKLKSSLRSYKFNDNYTDTNNPFYNAGFISNICFINFKSPVREMNAEHWIYAFWMRRVEQKNIKETEGILKLIYDLI